MASQVPFGTNTVIKALQSRSDKGFREGGLLRVAEQNPSSWSRSEGSSRLPRWRLPFALCGRGAPSHVPTAVALCASSCNTGTIKELLKPIMLKFKFWFT